MVNLQHYEFDVIAGIKIIIHRAINNEMDLQRARMSLDEDVEPFDGVSHIGIDYNGDVFMYSKSVTFCETQLKWGKEYEINAPDIMIMYIGSTGPVDLENIRTAMAPIETKVIVDILNEYYDKCEVYVDSNR